MNFVSGIPSILFVIIGYVSFISSSTIRDFGGTTPFLGAL